MALRITRASDPITVERLNVCIYGQPGIGKTSLAFTAASPLLLDFDRGSYRAANRKDVVEVADWRDVAGISANDLADYSTVILDTAGRALDVLSADILRRDPKKGYGGALNLQGYGQLKAEFTSFLKLLNGFGKDVILIAHMDEQRKGDEVLERLDVQGGSKNEIYKSADAMARLFVRGNKRELDFSPREGAFGKNPGQLDVLDVPSPERSPDFLAGVIAQIKDRLNSLTEAQREKAEKLEALRLALADVSDVDGINGLIPQAKALNGAGAALLNDRAKALGLVGNKATGQYEQKAAA